MDFGYSGQTWRIGANIHAAGDFTIQETGTTKIIIIDPSGDVGIGTSAPASHYGFGRTLEVQGSANAEINLSQTDNSKNWSMGIVNGSNYQQTDNSNYIWEIGGATKMKIDSDGVVTTGGQTGFLARGNTSQWLQGYASSWNTLVAGIAHGDGSTIGVNLTEGSASHFNGYDSGSDFNTSNGRFTAPADGKYLVHGSMYCTKISTNTGHYAHFLVYVNGQQINQMYTIGGYGTAVATDFSLNISTVLSLEEDDYVEWKVYTPSSDVRIYGDHICIGAHKIS